MATFLLVNYDGFNGKSYQVNIDVPGYAGPLVETSGKAELTYPTSRSFMETRRGCQLDFEVLITELTPTILDTLATISGDRQAAVKLFEDGQTLFEGWLRPDGLQRPFDSERYYLNLRAIDGLGYLEDIPYQEVPANGDTPLKPYTGNELELTILQRCLEATGISLSLVLYDFNLYFSVSPTDLPLASQAAIKNTYVNQDRYVEDNGEVFDCGKVVDAVLKKYGATIFYHKNQWHVIRIAEYYQNDTTTCFFERYSPAGTLEASGVHDKLKILGSQVEGTLSYHANRDQLITYNGSLGAYKVYYKYGFVKSVIANPEVIWNSTNANDIDDWNVINANKLEFNWVFPGNTISNPLRAMIIAQESSIAEDVLVQDPNSGSLAQIGEGEVGKLTINYIYQQKPGRMFANFILVLVEQGTGTRYYLQPGAGAWVTQQVRNTYHDVENNTFLGLFDVGVTNIDLPAVPVTGTLQIIFSQPVESVDFGQDNFVSGIVLTGVNLSGRAEEGVTGESYLAQKEQDIMVLTESEERIYVGDNPSDIYIGAIEDINGGQTNVWGRKALPSNLIPRPYFPVLKWLAQDRVSIQLNNQVQFSGSIAGEYFPYLGMLRINGFTGKAFMCIEYSWDTKRSTYTATHVEVQRRIDSEPTGTIRVTFKKEGQEVIDAKVIE